MYDKMPARFKTFQYLLYGSKFSMAQSNVLIFTCIMINCLYAEVIDFIFYCTFNHLLPTPIEYINAY